MSRVTKNTFIARLKLELYSGNSAASKVVEAAKLHVNQTQSVRKLIMLLKFSPIFSSEVMNLFPLPSFQIPIIQRFKSLQSIGKSY